MEPMSWMAIAGAAMSAVSSISQASAASAAAKSAAQASDYNAAIAAQNAQTASEQGNANEEAQRRKARMVMGAQRAALAEAGIGSDGTASDLVEQSAVNAEMDALNIRYGAQLQSTGFLNQSALDMQQAENQRKQASRATTAGYLNAGASALSGYGGYLQGQAKIKAASVGLGK
jgi:hypothetical protein